MTGVRITRPVQRLASLIDQPGGRTEPAALAAAHSGIDAMEDRVVETLRHKLHDVWLALAPDGAGHGDAGASEGARLAEAYRKADDVNSLAGLVGLGQVGGVMLLLCDLLHLASASGRLHPLAIEIYRLCTRRLDRLPDIGNLSDVMHGLRSLNATCATWANEGEPTPHPLCRVVYASTSDLRGDAFDNVTAEVLARSIEGNAGLGITGVLAADDGWYLQCIEGRPEAVAAVVDSLLFDQRHHAPRILSARLVAERSFAAWSLCFHRLSALHDAILARTRGNLSVPDLSGAAAFALLNTIAVTARSSGAAAVLS